MNALIEAVYEDGVFKPKSPPALAEGTEVNLLVLKANGVELDVAPDDDDPLKDVIGICDGDGPIDGAENHDKYLYGKLLS